MAGETKKDDVVGSMTFKLIWEVRAVEGGDNMEP